MTLTPPTMAAPSPSRKDKKTSLREGFTTGSAATAAALAALRLLLTNTPPSIVDIPLPPFTNGTARARLAVAVHSCVHIPSTTQQSTSSPGANIPPPPRQEAVALVIKDGGDDPDATAHARIKVYVRSSLKPMVDNKTVTIHLEGGSGVGRVTLPGLPVPVGQAAINPTPREQICHALQAECHRHNLGGTIHVLICVENGQELARHTMNARLGIVGGISILGTHGIVKPFSHSAWQKSILQSLHVAQALQCHTVCLSTGRRSEKLLMAHYPELSEHAFVQVADFARFSLHSAGKLGFKRIVWGCFFGKLLKLAQGIAYTHAHSTQLNITHLVHIAHNMGLPHARVAELQQCITANHALDLLLGEAVGKTVIRHVARLAQHNAYIFAGRPVDLLLFHLDGRTLLTL